MTPDTLDAVAAAMAAAGDVAVLEVSGRRTARRYRTAVGYVRDADGSLLVAASSPYTHWARNLEAAGRCRVTIGDATAEYDATRIPDGERGRVVVELILRYGTPAERLGAGPAFRLLPRSGGASA